MNHAGFLENLYRGQFVRELSNPSAPPPDEEKVKALAAKFHDAVAPYDLRKLDAGQGVPPELMRKLAEIGTFGIIIPREYGGLGMTLQEYLRVIEELSSADMSLGLIPMAHLSIGVKGILLFGTEEQKKRWLPPAARGETIFAYALTEPETGSDAQHVRTTARPCDDGRSWMLEGTKTYITNANYAGAFTVFAQLGEPEEGRMGVFVVERGAEGLTVGPDMAKMGLAVSSTATVRLHGVRVPASHLIGAPGDGFRIAMTILNYGRLGLGASSSGLISQSLKDMAARAGSRTQFGMAIREFELIQEKLVRARVHGFAAAAMTAFTAALLQADPLSNVGIESSHSKLYGTTRCWDTLYDAQQTAGGAGYLSTLPYEKRMRDFRVTTIFEGTTEIHSIYPPLTLARAYGKELAAKGLLGKLAGLARLSGTRALRGARESNRVLKAAVRTAGRSEALFRSLLAWGLRRHGNRIAAQEFLLRRMTHLSLSLFWLMASVWYLKRRHPAGDYPEADLSLIAYLAEEARELQQRDGRRQRSRIEDLHRQIIRSI